MATYRDTLADQKQKVDQIIKERDEIKKRIEHLKNEFQHFQVMHTINTLKHEALKAKHKRIIESLKGSRGLNENDTMA